MGKMKNLKTDICLLTNSSAIWFTWLEKLLFASIGRGFEEFRR
jgi:hypothetical protein